MHFIRSSLTGAILKYFTFRPSHFDNGDLACKCEASNQAQRPPKNVNCRGGNCWITDRTFLCQLLKESVTMFPSVGRDFNKLVYEQTAKLMNSLDFANGAIPTPTIQHAPNPLSSFSSSSLTNCKPTIDFPPSVKGVNSFSYAIFSATIPDLQY